MPRKRPFGEGLEKLKSAPLEKKPRQQVEPAKSYVEQVTKDRPVFGQIPDDFMKVARHETAGIRVHKSRDKNVAAIQFSDDKPPSREEKDVLEALSEPEHKKFTYKPDKRHWERRKVDGDEPGHNTVDALRIATELADARNGRGR